MVAGGGASARRSWGSLFTDTLTNIIYHGKKDAFVLLPKYPFWINYETIRLFKRRVLKDRTKGKGEKLKFELKFYDGYKGKERPRAVIVGDRECKIEKIIWRKRIIDKKTDSLEEAKILAEKAKRRVIGITVETRPDYCKETHIDNMLHFGTTRVEIGIQTIYNEIYDFYRMENNQKGIESLMGKEFWIGIKSMRLFKNFKYYY